METIEIARIMKEMIYEKEFFIYPQQEIKEFNDIILYKQIWFNSLYINFLKEDFIYSPLQTQKNVISNIYNPLKARNRFKNVGMYLIIPTKNTWVEGFIQQLSTLSHWIREQGMKINILLVDFATMKVEWSYYSFEDKENLKSFLEELPTYEFGHSEQINLLEIEKQVKISKGYYFTSKGHLTKLIMAINIIFFAYIAFRSGSTDIDIYHLIRYGAKYNPLIADGDYYRLLSSVFIHVNLIHLALNSYALNILGKDGESIYGPPKFLFIYLISGIFGSLGSFIFSKAVSAGASGAIFGLMGSYFYFGIKKPLIFSTRYGLNLVTLLIINIVFGLSSGNIDNFAHFGGLVGGILSSWALGLKSEKSYSYKGIFKITTIIILVLSLLFYGIQINQEAWEYNLHKGIKYLQQEDFENAKAQFEVGLEKNNSIPEFYFYLAYIYYHQGNQTSAIEYLNKTLELNPSDTMAKRFLDEITR